jgi:predicted metal-binding membrane protein
MSDRGSLVRPRSQQGIPVAVALAAVAAAAWLVLGSGVGHTTHDDVLGSGHAPDPAAVAALLGGWTVMVAAMMLPPEIASMAAGRPCSSRSWWSEAGFVAVTTCTAWTGFAILALTGDAVVHEVAESRPQLAGLVAPAVLVGAGAFQLSTPHRHLLAAARESRATPWRRAIWNVGSCGGLMLVVFALEVGNLLAMAALTAVMTLERAATPRMERLTAALVGWALIAAAALVAIQPGLAG